MAINAEETDADLGILENRTEELLALNQLFLGLLAAAGIGSALYLSVVHIYRCPNGRRSLTEPFSNGTLDPEELYLIADLTILSVMTGLNDHEPRRWYRRSCEVPSGVTVEVKTLESPSDVLPVRVYGGQTTVELGFINYSG